MRKKNYLILIVFLVLTGVGIKKYQQYLVEQKISQAKKELIISEKALRSFVSHYFNCEKKRAMEVSVANHELRVRNLVALVPEQYVLIESTWEPLKLELTKKIEQCSNP